MFKKKIITRFDDKPYLIRWTLFTCRWFSIKVHKALTSDDACLHDHPWPFLTFIFWRGYREESYRFDSGQCVINSTRDSEEFKLNGVRAEDMAHLKVTRNYQAPCVLWRPAYYTHRLIIDKPSWSLVITFKKRRQWGFWTPAGWKAWFTYKQQDQC